MDRFIQFLNRRYKLIIVIFFVIYFIAGILIYKDYGISLDEHSRRDSGMVIVKYFLNGDKALLQWKDRYYGPFLEIILILIEKSFNLTAELQSVYFMRHLVNFLVFFISVIVFYKMCKFLFKDWKYGLIGSLFLILSPRIFADSFFNSKDLAFMSFFLISMYTMMRFLEKKSLANAALHSLACAVAINVRIMGILIPLMTVVFFILDILIIKNESLSKKTASRNFLIYILTTAFVSVLLFPTSWSNPLYSFLQAFSEMSRYHWNGYNLYLGEYVPGGKAPWHYTFIWVIITTPLLYTGLFFAGVFNAVRLFLKDSFDFYIKNRHIIMAVLLFFLPLAALIIYKSVLYGGWRQTFFIYPAFLLMGIYGLNFMIEKINLKNINFKKQMLRKKVIFVSLFAIIILSFANTLYFMAAYHPYQNMYFNILAGKNMPEVKNNFEIDYWGVTYRKGFEYILAAEKNKNIKVYVSSYIGRWSAEILNNSERSRLIYVDNPDDADYY
ncbi:MAG: glycosyltransferase family 39 protein, partial [Actinobacteria bacterium]|nr:glycosyltransferase family 39 protein [Actinomycetota bacterium]